MKILDVEVKEAEGLPKNTAIVVAFPLDMKFDSVEDLAIYIATHSRYATIANIDVGS